MSLLDAYIEQEEAKLRALQDFLEQLNEAQAVESSQVVATPHQETTPDGLLDLENQKREVFGQMNRYHALLCHVKTDAEREALATEITRLDDQLRDLWDQIDYLNTHGQLKPKKEEAASKSKVPRGAPDFEQDSINQLVKKRNNARAYISNAAKRNFSQENVALRKQWIEAIDKHLEA